MESLFTNQLLFGEGILNRLHIFAGSWLDAVMLIITSAGSEMFYLIMLPILYWCWDKRKAIYAGTVFLISISINDALKELYNNPRPDPSNLLPGIAELASRYSPKGPGFPSGHTQGAISFWGPIALLLKDLRIKTGCLALIILILYSRLYLGVHFLGDVIGGLFFGGVCLAFMIPVAGIMEKYYDAVNRFTIISLLLAIPIVIYNIVPGWHINTNMGALSGFLTGAILAEERVQFNPSNKIVNQLLKIAIGITCGMAIRFGLKAILPDTLTAGFFRYWFIGFWCTFGAPLVFSKIGSLGGEIAPEPGNCR